MHENIDASKISTAMQSNTEVLLWSNSSMVAFLDVTSAFSLYLKSGRKTGKAFRNNNTTCDRLIGQIKNAINKNRDTDNVNDKIIGYIHHV